MQTFASHHQTMGRSIRNVTAGVTLAIAAVVAGESAFANNIPAAADRGTQGEWSEPFDLGITAINSALLQTGKVLFWGETIESQRGNIAKLWDPSGTLTEVTVPEERDIFCSGETHLADGRLMVIGGHEYHGPGAVGVKQTNFFDPTTETWSLGPDMSQTRWYPDVIENPDGTIVVIGGQHDPFNVTVEVERYDPATNAFTTLPPSANNAVGSYARTVVLPNGQVFMAGPNQDTDLLNSRTNRWRFVGNFNIGPRHNGLAVLLPGLNQVMAIGGAQVEDTPATNTAEIIDFSVPTPTWQYTASMSFARVQANAVLLPDGTVLVVGGCLQGLSRRPVNAAEVFDPVSQTWTVLASSPLSKAHHSTALLLPDGRVWSAGGDPRLPLETYAQLFSPPYLFKGPQPVINQVQQTLAYNQSFSIFTHDALNIARVALIKLGATTHDENFDQRYVDLTFRIRSGAVQATSPSNSKQAPPGWYMLFIVTGDGIPSLAPIVLLQ